MKDWRTLGSLPTLLQYNCIDAMRTYEIAQAQKAYIKSIGQEDQMALRWRRTSLSSDDEPGSVFNQGRAGSMLYELQAALTAFHTKLLAIIPQDMVMPHTKKSDKFWYKSAKQTAELFYNILGMQSVAHRKTGNRTVGKEALMVLQRKYPSSPASLSASTTPAQPPTPAPLYKWQLNPMVECDAPTIPEALKPTVYHQARMYLVVGLISRNLSKGEEDE